MSIPKTTYTQRYSLKDLMDRGGAVMTSEWTTGAGRHTRSRTIPPFCERIVRSEAARYPARIKRVFAQHPRCQAVVAITDMRTANRAVIDTLFKPPCIVTRTNLSISGIKLPCIITSLSLACSEHLEDQIMKSFQFRSGIDEVLDFRTEASNTISALVNYLLENADALGGATVEIFGVEENTVYVPHVQIKFADEVVEYIVAEEANDDD